MDHKTVPMRLDRVEAGKVLQDACHGQAYNMGWWMDLETGEDKSRPVPELLCLVHSEVSEALEGYRKDLMDDHLTDRKMLEVELADAVIRIFDMAGGLGLDLSGAIDEKLAYNLNRADHQVANRKLDGGKKI